jgi:thiamine-phosphate pyrophosphorylase
VLPTPLYVILDRGAAAGRELPALLDGVLAGGCRVVQLREKSLPAVELHQLAGALRRRCREAGCLFIVNDRVDLALATEADGVHAGQDDLPASEARRILRPGVLLGVSTHDEDQARRRPGRRRGLRRGGQHVPHRVQAGLPARWALIS